MPELRQKIEQWFEGFGHHVYRHRWVTLVAMLVLVAALGSQLPRLEIDTSTEAFLHPRDPILKTYNEFRKQFGRDEFIILAIEPPEVFDQDFLQKLKAFHEELEAQVPHIQEITSLLNARNTRGQGDQLIVGDLLAEWPRDDHDLALLRQRVLSNPIYRNMLVSEDGRFTTVVIKTDTYSSAGFKPQESEILQGFSEAAAPAKPESKDDVLEGFEEQPAGEEIEPPFLTDAENNAVITALERVMHRYQAPNFKIYLAGTPVLTDVLKRSMVKDAQTFIRFVLLTIAVCLLIMFRRVTGLVLPLLIVAFAVLSTLGLMAIAGVPITLPTNILPSFILAVGIGASVHVLAIFYQNFQTSRDREEAICHALGHSGLAIVLTSLTTAAGLASFITAELAPIAHLGIFATTGVLAALVYTILLLPACLALIPVRFKQGGAHQNSSSRMDRILAGVADFATGHPKAITAVGLFIMMVCLVGMFRLSFTHDPLSWLPSSLPLRGDTRKVDQELKGSVALEVILDTGRVNGLYDVETLNTLERLARDLEGMAFGKRHIGKIISLTDILKEIHQALNENRPDYYVIPQDAALIPQEFLLFENSGSDDLEDVVDSQFRKARFTIKVPWDDAIGYMPYLIEVETRFRRAFQDQAEITTTGLMTLFVRTFYAAIHTMARSYILAGLVITLMMILLIGSLRVGLISMIPNLLPIILTLGVMGWLGFPLNLFTMLIGSIAIGLAVDDTVHFMHNFRRYYGETGDARDSVRRTLHTAGRAMLVTSIVLALGFANYMFAEMQTFFYFGLLTAITIIVALLADFLLAPALMILIPLPQWTSKQGGKP